MLCFNEINDLRAPECPWVPFRTGFEPHQPPQKIKKSPLPTERAFLFCAQQGAHPWLQVPLRAV
jgi:hypothetical protein